MCSLFKTVSLKEDAQINFDFYILELGPVNTDIFFKDGILKGHVLLAQNGQYKFDPYKLLESLDHEGNSVLKAQFGNLVNQLAKDNKVICSIYIKPFFHIGGSVF